MLGKASSAPAEGRPPLADRRLPVVSVDNIKDNGNHVGPAAGAAPLTPSKRGFKLPRPLRHLKKEPRPPQAVMAVNAPPELSVRPRKLVPREAGSAMPIKERGESSVQANDGAARNSNDGVAGEKTLVAMPTAVRSPPSRLPRPVHGPKLATSPPTSSKTSSAAPMHASPMLVSSPPARTPSLDPTTVVLLHKTLDAWRHYVWEQNHEWKLSVRADIRHQYAVCRSAFSTWAAYVKVRRAKAELAAKACIMRRLSLLRSNFHAWRAAALHRAQEESGDQWLSDRARHWRVMRLWMKWANGAESRVYRRRLEETSVRIDARRQCSIVLRVWRRRLNERRSVGRAMVMAEEHHHWRLLQNVIDEWRTYVLSQQWQQANMGIVCACDRSCLYVTRSPHLRNQIVHFSARAVHFRKHVIAARAFHHWKFARLHHDLSRDTDRLAAWMNQMRTRRHAMTCWRMTLGRVRELAVIGRSADLCNGQRRMVCQNAWSVVYCLCSL